MSPNMVTPSQSSTDYEPRTLSRLKVANSTSEILEPTVEMRTRQGTNRFAFVSTMNGAPWGGSEELWSQTALHLREQGHDVRASVLNWSRFSERLVKLDNAGVRAKYRPRERKWPSRQVWRCLRAFHPGPLEFPEVVWLRKVAPDLVVISQGGPWDGIPWMLQCQRLGLPYCGIIQANSEIWWPADDELASIRLALQHASRLFFVSHANRELMEAQCGVRLGNAEIVANPLNMQSREEVPEPANSKETHIACVGRLEPRAKGQDILMQVLALPKWRQRPIQLHLYGTGCGEQSLRSLVSLLQLEKVHFHGHVADVRGIWASNHALILPSRYEGLPLVIVEAMLCGRTVITTDVAGITELVQDGFTGFVAPAPTVRLVDEAFERAWMSRPHWEEIGHRARTRALEFIPADPVRHFGRILMSIAQQSSVDSKKQARHLAPA